MCYNDLIQEFFSCIVRICGIWVLKSLCLLLSGIRRLQKGRVIHMALAEYERRKDEKINGIIYDHLLPDISMESSTEIFIRS